MQKTKPASESTNGAATISRDKLIELLNEDLSREYQAIVAYVVYSQVIKGAQYMNIAGELELHAKEELDHALIISKQIDYLGGAPTVQMKPVKTSEKAEDMLRFDLDNETETVRELPRARAAVRGAGRVRDGRADSRHPGAGTGAPDRPGDRPWNRRPEHEPARVIRTQMAWFCLPRMAWFCDLTPSTDAPIVWIEGEKTHSRRFNQARQPGRCGGGMATPTPERRPTDGTRFPKEVR